MPSEVWLCIASSSSLIDLHTHTNLQTRPCQGERTEDQASLKIFMFIVQLVCEQTAELWQSLCSRKQALLTLAACSRASFAVPHCFPHRATPSSVSCPMSPCSAFGKPWVRSTGHAWTWPREPAGAIKYQTTVTKQSFKIEQPCEVTFLDLHAKRHKMSAIISVQV